MSSRTSNISLQFPPLITVNRRRSSTNAFLIYRKEFINNLNRLNYNLENLEVSKLAALYWKNESKDVREAYCKVAKKVAEVNELNNHREYARLSRRLLKF